MILEVAGHALMITGFVFVMMLVIEYLNVLTRGNWDRVIARWRWGQSVFSSFLGATPGCLGAFAVGSLYMHRVLTLGALVAAMVATSGDEAFVMLALFPGRALLIFALLFAIGILSGLLVDTLFKARRAPPAPYLETYAATHTGVEECIPFSGRELVGQWRRCVPERGLLAVFLVIFVMGVVSGKVGHHHLGVEPRQQQLAQVEHHEHAAPAESGHEHGGWTWVRVTLLAVGLIGLLIVVTVPDHFLKEHLWNHIVRVHVWRIFLWTLGALLVTHVLVEKLDIEAALEAHKLPVLLLACLVGIIPESGPHLVFVTLYAQGAVPFSVLLASSIVQDGHGMIPILAHSRTAFASVKAINFVIGLAVGLLGYAMGW